MPESPEVQALADFLSARAVGRRIVALDVLLPKIVKAGSPAAAAGGLIDAVGRRGKMLDVALSSGAGPAHLVVHWGHDGWLLWHDVVPEGTRRSGEATLLARVRLDDGSGFDLTDDGPWKALTLFAVADPSDVPAVAALGPDPTASGFARSDVATAVAGRRKQLKALLQDQKVFAGIGNAYSDEILHAARLSPVMHASTLDDAQIDRLFDASRSVLIDAAAARRGSRPEALKDDKRADMRVHRRPGEACLICGDTIREITFSGAAAHYCPTCQTGGQPLP
ncbi:DNA-formamidopyrimidine glycosylase family protein [Microbacterium sp. 1P10UB]|uniref:Fpg/Nei family DNA glycosylase n=1 Tax=unclassified Microbacterium TaxID=2609290 RepID=UPI00399F1F5C